MPRKYNDKAETNKWNRVNTKINKINERDAIRRQFEGVSKNIRAAYARKVIASIALCRWYSARAQETFRRFQNMNVFWNNQTGAAYNQVFSESIVADNEIGFLLAHQVDYGIYLELSNDRKHEALWPIIRDLDSEFEIALRSIWND